MQLCRLVDAIPLVTDTIGDFIDLQDLMQAHVALAHVGEPFSAHVWQSRASDKCNGFDMSEALFDPKCRPQVLRCIPTLISACLARGVRVPINSMDCFRKLWKHLDNARRTADAHAASGYRAQVLIGCVRFPGEGLEELLSSGLWGHGGSDIVRKSILQQGRSGLVSSTADRFVAADPIDVHESATIQEEQAGESTAPARWANLQLALSTGGLLASAVGVPDLGTRSPDMAPSFVQDQPQDERRSTRTMPAVTVDLATVCHEVTIHLRGLVLEVNGEVRRSSSSGMFFFSRGKAAAAKAFTRGVLCVLCFRDGRVVPKTVLASSLNLDRRGC